MLQGATPLHTAVIDQVETVAKILLEAGADINAVDNKVHAPAPAYSTSSSTLHATLHVHVLQGMTCLHHAVCEGDNEMVQFLLQHGPDVTLTDHAVCPTAENHLYI